MISFNKIPTQRGLKGTQVQMPITSVIVASIILYQIRPKGLYWSKTFPISIKIFKSSFSEFFLYRNNPFQLLFSLKIKLNSVIQKDYTLRSIIPITSPQPLTVIIMIFTNLIFLSLKAIIYFLKCIYSRFMLNYTGWLVISV